MEALAVPLLLAIGALLALQAAANVQLSGATGNPLAASTLQLGIGAAALVAAAAVAGAVGAFELLRDADPWHLTGGLGSALYITAGILLFPRLGAVVSVGLFIAGQMLASLALDGFGWLGGEADRLGAAQLAGGAAVVAGTALIVLARAGVQAVAGAARQRPVWLALGLLAGAALPVQGAVNAQLRLDLGEPVAVGAFSFVVAAGAAGLLLSASLLRSRGPAPRVEPLRSMPWWGWLGGLVGASYVMSVFLLLPEIGAAATIGLTVAGQQLASVAVDRHGLLRLPRRPVPPLRMAGVATLLAGVAAVQLA